MQGLEPGYPLDRRSGGSQNRRGHCPCKDWDPDTHWMGGFIDLRTVLDTALARIGTPAVAIPPELSPLLTPLP
jgi:hypothetical protein